MKETIDRVRTNTSDDVNKELDRQTAVRIREFAGLNDHDLTKKIEELDREWDIERVLQTMQVLLD